MVLNVMCYFFLRHGVVIYIYIYICVYELLSSSLICGELAHEFVLVSCFTPWLVIQHFLAFMHHDLKNGTRYIQSYY